MDSKPVPFDDGAALGAMRAIIRRNPDDVEEIEMVEATWGSNPRFSGGTSFRFVRSESQNFPSHRCLIPASEFHMTIGERRFRVTREDGNFFYLAGVWEPAMAEWPLSYRIITVEASREVLRHQERHGAIIERRQVMQWLDGSVAEAELLATPPPGTFVVTEINPKPVQTALVL